MRDWVKSCGVLACLICSSFAGAMASDATLQDFDGWRITIQPGPTNIPESVIRPVSFNSREIPPTPEGVSPPPAPRPDVVPPAVGRPMVGTVIGPNSDGLPIITPGESSQCCDPTPVVSPPDGTVDTRYLSQAYVNIYKSIPFIRAEYEANPSYIHDTAVEFTFGKMRPTTIVRGTVNLNQNSPYSYGGHGSPYGYGGYGYGGYGYGYGFGGYPSGLAYPPIQLVVPGTGLRIHRSY